MKPPRHVPAIITWGRCTMPAARWAQEPDVWLRGITLEVLQARLWPKQGPAWTPAQALETPVLDGEDEMRWNLLFNPPKGRAGAEARRVRKALLFRAAPALVPLHVLEQARDEIRLLEGATADMFTQISEAKAANEALQREVEQLKEATKHHPELSALYGWWWVAVEDLETPKNRIFDVLKRMFGEGS